MRICGDAGACVCYLQDRERGSQWDGSGGTPRAAIADAADSASWGDAIDPAQVRAFVRAAEAARVR